MQNLIFQPASSEAAQLHFKKSIADGLTLEEIKPFLDEGQAGGIGRIFGNKKLEVWGVTPSNSNKYDKSNIGDLVLFSANRKIFYIAQLAYKVHAPKLAEYLWGQDENGDTWEHIYFLIGGTKDDIPVKELNRLVGNDENDVIMGFRLLKSEKTEELLKRYGSLENALAELQSEFTEPTDFVHQTIDSEAEKIGDRETLKSFMDMMDVKMEKMRAQEKTRTIKAIVRNKKIADSVKEIHGYRCQICGLDGFEKKDGGLYAEAHHKEELAISHWDHPDNMICVCPLCHRKLHYGKEEPSPAANNFKIT